MSGPRRFNEFVRGTHYVNGIESFWSYAKRRLQKFNGFSARTFYLHLKECEYRFNNRDKDLSRLLRSNLKEDVFKFFFDVVTSLWVMCLQQRRSQVSAGVFSLDSPAECSRSHPCHLFEDSREVALIRERVVSKDELLDHIWTGVFTTDAVLKQAVSQVRRVLGDSPVSPRYIQTFHSRGYDDEFRILVDQSRAALAREDYAAALAKSSDAAKIANDPNFRDGVGFALVEQSNAHRGLGQMCLAVTSAEEGLRLLEETGLGERWRGYWTLPLAVDVKPMLSTVV